MKSCRWSWCRTARCWTAPRLAPNWYEDYVYWEYGSPEADDRDLADPDTRHKGWMIMMLDSYVNLDMAKPVTVRAYNAADGLVLEEEITLAVTTGSW